MLPKMGEKTLSFVEKAYEFARQNPTLCPQYLDMYLFDIDFADAHGLWTLLNTATQLQENIDDTAMCAGSESYIRRVRDGRMKLPLRKPRTRSRWSLISIGGTKGKWLERFSFRKRPP
jgi:hypothetical protein